jgi:hypothetical protein
MEGDIGRAYTRAQIRELTWEHLQCPCCRSTMAPRDSDWKPAPGGFSNAGAETYWLTEPPPCSEQGCIDS